MKRAILALLASATLANAGLTGSQIQQVINYEDKFGFVYIGPKDTTVLSNGKQSIQRLMVFHRAIDGEYECLNPEACGTVMEAINQLLGSKFMWELNAQSQSHSDKTDY
jgi:hypothetical protein